MATRLIILSLAAAAAASPLAHQKRQATVIASCTRPNTIALTFDDGPFDYTDSVLDKLDEAGMKATFFVNGQNFGSIYDYADSLQRADADGHQIASHTWSHPDIQGLSAEDLTSEMTRVEEALLEIIGKFPTYMRPPYFSWNGDNLDVLGELGYKVIHADLDTNDWRADMDASIDEFESGIAEGRSIVLAHEVHHATAEELVPAMISAVQEAGLEAVTVGECLGDPEDNWYRTSRDGFEPQPSETPSESSAPSASRTDSMKPTGTPSDPSGPSAIPSNPSEPSETPSGPSATLTHPTGASDTPSPTDDATNTPYEPSETPSPTHTSSETPSKPADDPTYPEPSPTKAPGRGCRAKTQKRKVKKAKRSASRRAATLN
ncbi:hypothetical protein VUR80DRAFT_1446 [Thermomyces stellatus]